MSDESKVLQLFTNGTDWISAYSVEDAHAYERVDCGVPTEDDAEPFVLIPDEEEVAFLRDEVLPPPGTCCASLREEVEPSASPIQGHHHRCEVPYERRPAREWASQGRGFVASTEC